jgi:hypothetical protein
MTRPGWLILSRRYGGEERDPSGETLADALRELFVEDLPGMTDTDYAEHGAASLRYGFDDGPMFAVEVDRRGRARFEEWADQDYERELSAPRTARVRSLDEALQLWTLLATGDVDALRRWRWNSEGDA